MKGKTCSKMNLLRKSSFFSSLRRCATVSTFRTYHVCSTNGVVLLTKPDRGLPKLNHHCRANKGTQYISKSYFHKKETSQITDLSYPLTTYEAEFFLQERLKIDNHRQKFKDDKLALLNLIILRMRYTVPFTNLPVVSQKKLERGYPTPTFEEMKEEIISCRGGPCFWINTFMKTLLETIGFNTSYIGAQSPLYSKVENFHTCVIAHDVTYPGSVHLVEVGDTHPIFQAIDTDFVRESETLYFGHTKTKYFHVGEEKLRHCELQTSGDIVHEYGVTKVDQETWTVIHEYNITRPRTLSQCLTIVQWLLLNLADVTVSEYYDIYIIGCPNGRLVSIGGRTLEAMDNNGNKFTKKTETDEELKMLIKEYYPKTSTLMIDRAIKNVYSQTK